jgi:hypothetical protein
MVLYPEDCKGYEHFCNSTSFGFCGWSLMGGLGFEDQSMVDIERLPG